MKWLWSLIVLMAMPVLGQTTTVTANPVQDTDGQTWNNGNLIAMQSTMDEQDKRVD